MHSNWEEMLPFYIAGTLPKNETTRLENHLSRCGECRRSLKEWRLIADVVRADASSQMSALPPLSNHVLRLAAQQATVRAQQPVTPIRFASYAPPRRTSAPVMLIAALFTVVIFGGLLGLLVLRGTLPQPGMDVANLPTATETVTPAPSASKTPDAPTPKPQIIVIEPSATPISPTPILPTVTPTIVQPTRRPPTAILPPTVVQPTTTPLMQPTPTDIEAFSLIAPIIGTTCTIQAAIPGASVNLYAGAGIDYAVVATFSQDATLTALARRDDGWYNAEHVLASGDAVVGWVRQDQVFLSGACDNLPLIPSGEATTETAASETPTVLPQPSLSPTPGIASGSWSQTTTVLSSTCATPPVGSTTTVSLSSRGDALSLSSAETGAFSLQRIGEQTYAGSYTTASASVSVSLTFTSGASYSGSAVATSTDDCVTQSAWSGIYAG